VEFQCPAHKICLNSLLPRYDTVMSIRFDADGVDDIPLSFIKLLLPVVLPVVTHIFNHIFVSSEFPEKWKTSVVLSIPKVGRPAKFSDNRPSSFLVCLSTVFEVDGSALLDFVGIIAQLQLY
jgi:hypothetical protein